MRRRGRGGRIRRLGDQSGSLMIEVVISAALVALIVGPIATALAGTVDQARAVQELAGKTPGPEEALAQHSWEWGLRVCSAWWRPGPVLHIKVAGVDRTFGGVVVGLWGDGWLQQEAVVPEDSLEAGEADDLTIEAWDWTGRAGEELIIRVRTPEGIWGPPWRSAVPDGAGGPPDLGEALLPAVEADAVVHRAQISTSSLDVTWSTGALSSPPFGLVFVLQPEVVGWAGATLDGRSQWWWMEDGRDVHVYF